MTSLTNDLIQQLQGAPLDQVAGQLGIDRTQAAGAISAAVPLLMGALGRNASQPQGAEALYGALRSDHAGGGDVGSLLGSVLGGAQGRQVDGAGILGHIFGDRQPRAQAGLGQATGLPEGKAAMLLKILAPIVMGYLAKRMLQPGPAASTPVADNPQALGSVLHHESQAVARHGGVGGGLLGAVLDRDGDGQLGLGDVLKLGGGLLGGASRPGAGAGVPPR